MLVAVGRLPISRAIKPPGDGPWQGGTIDNVLPRLGISGSVTGSLIAAGGIMRRLRFCVAFLPLFSACILVSCQGTGSQGPTSNGPSSDLLYVIGNGTVSTYAVDNNALSFTSVGQPVNLIQTGSFVQF